MFLFKNFFNNKIEEYHFYNEDEDKEKEIKSNSRIKKYIHYNKLIDYLSWKKK